MPHALYSPEITQLLIDEDAEGLRALCDTLHPATVAEALDDDFSPDEVWAVLAPSDIRTQAAIFEYLPIARQVEMVEGRRARPEVGQLIGKMSHDDRVDLLNRVPGRVKEALLRVVDEADRRDIATLGVYGENTVGALMTTDYAWLPPTLTAAEAVDHLRTQAPDRETIYYVFILDDPDRKAGGLAPRRLLGVMSLRDLILAPRHALIRDVMESDSLVTLRAADDREVAADLLARYDFIALPVLDESGGMVGIVTHDDVIDVIQEEATEALQQQAGVSPLGASYLEAPFWSVWWNRVRVLAVVFVLGWGTAYAIDYFEETLKAVAVLTLFIPLCTATGGNSGTQAATLVTRALALGELTLGSWARVLWHELRMGLAMGAVLAALGFARAFLVDGGDLSAGPAPLSAERLGVVLGLAVLAVCLLGTLVGAMLPLVFRRVGADPALASSPAVTTLVDVLGIVVYFSIATRLL